MKPGVEIYLFRGTYDEILRQENIKVWNGQWQNGTDMQPVIVNNMMIYGPNYYSEISIHGEKYCFFSIGQDTNGDRILYKFESINIEGPYDMVSDFYYKFPQWVNDLGKKIDVYSLRSHPGLVPIVQKQDENVEFVLSYVIQGIFPRYSGLFFDPLYSSYDCYYPQFIFINK
jgi:hypothetical protein